MDGDDIDMEEYDVITCVRLAMQNTLPGIDFKSPDATTLYLQESLVMDIMDEGAPEDEADAQNRFCDMILEIGSDLEEDDIRCGPHDLVLSLERGYFKHVRKCGFGRDRDFTVTYQIDSDTLTSKRDFCKSVVRQLAALRAALIEEALRGEPA
eukprot:3516243-Pyramimonas_sp.AAC.1